MKKILFVTEVMAGGGVGTVLKDIVKNLPKEDFNVTIFSFFKDETFYKIYDNNINYIYEFEVDSININRLSFKDREDIIKARENEVIEKLNNEKFDIVVSIKEGRITKFVSNLECKNKFSFVHVNYKEGYYTNAYFTEKEELECMKKFKKIICVSKNVKQTIIEKIGDPGNLCVKYNPIDNNKIIEKSKENIDFDLPKNKLNFITVGRLAEQKGYDRLIDVSNKLLDEGFDFNLYIIGFGEIGNLQRLKNRVKYQNNIQFLDRKLNPYPYMVKSDCFICSSIWEAYGIAIQESIILHVPVLMTDCPGATEVFENGKQGIIVENSENGIYNGMKEILENKQKLEEYKRYLKKDRYVKLEERLKSIIDLFDEI